MYSLEKIFETKKQKKKNEERSCLQRGIYYLPKGDGVDLLMKCLLIYLGLHPSSYWYSDVDLRGLKHGSIEFNVYVICIS